MNTTLIQFSVINQYNSSHWQDKVESHRTKSVDTHKKKKEYGQSSVTSAIESLASLGIKENLLSLIKATAKIILTDILKMIRFILFYVNILPE